MQSSIWKGVLSQFVKLYEEYEQDNNVLMPSVREVIKGLQQAWAENLEAQLENSKLTSSLLCKIYSGPFEYLI